MSVLDELSAMEDKVRTRLNELRPLLDEYAELERVAQRLGIFTEEAGAASSGEAPAAPKAQRSRTSRSSRSRATKAASARTKAKKAPAASAAGSDRPASKRTRSAAGKRKSHKPGTSRGTDRAARVAALVKQRPGLTVRDVGTELGVDPTSLYRIVRRLETEGQLKKQGQELQPV